MVRWTKASLGEAGISVNVSHKGSLIFFDKKRFAVKRGSYKKTTCPYLQAGTNIGGVHIESQELTLKFRDKTTIKAIYDYYEQADIGLPNTCIESAEHVIKSMHSGRSSGSPYKNGDGTKVVMSMHGEQSADIDDADMIEWATESIPGGPSRKGFVDSARETFVAGEGMALVYSSSEERQNDEWTVHAVAVLLNSELPTDPFIVVSEIFAPDDNKPISMTKDWELSFFSGPLDFKMAYQKAMPPNKYSLWKIAPVKVATQPKGVRQSEKVVSGASSSSSAAKSPIDAVRGVQPRRSPRLAGREGSSSSS